MTNSQARYRMMEYHAKQLSCAPEDFLSDTNKVIRAQDPSDAFFVMRCFGNAAVAKAHPSIAEWCEEYIRRHDGFRCYDGIQMSQIYEQLRKHGYYLGCGQGAIVDYSVAKREVPHIPYETRFIGRSEAAAFIASEFDLAKWPMLASTEDTEAVIAAFDQGRAIGVAFSDRYTDTICDIGYEVDPGYHRQGIATSLTMELTNRLLAEDVILHAKFAWSNIASKSVLYRCGYYAAWSNMGSASAEWAARAINGFAD